MGFLDNVKDGYKKQQAKAAELKDTRGNKLDGLTVDYMGGYDDHRKSAGILTFYEKQTEFKVPLNKKLSFTILNSNISNIALEGKDEVNRRVTVTRLLAIGIFAFAFKKKSKDKESFITVVLTDGQEVVFLVKDKSPMELKAKLSKAISRLKQIGHMSAIASSVPLSAADELAKFAKLKEQGVITQDEYDKKKAELLA